MPEITTEWQRFEQLSTDLLYKVLRFRQSIFIVEQRSPYPDLDGLDQDAWHLLLQVNGGLAGYLRLIPMPGASPQIRIGRVSVAAHFRRHGLGRMLMEESLSLGRREFPAHDLVLGAQVHLVSFYRTFGFEAISEPHDEFGVSHVEMVMRQKI